MEEITGLVLYFITVYILAHMYAIIHMYDIIWQRIQNIGLVTGLGGHFVTKVCSRRGCSATNPSATSPLKTTVLYTGPRQGFVTEGPRQRFVTEGRGSPATTRVWIHSHIYIYKVHMHIHTMFVHIHTPIHICL